MTTRRADSTVSLTGRLHVAPAATRILVARNAWKLGAATSTVYVPGSNFSNWNSPDGSVAAVQIWPVASFVDFTVAPATTPPDASVTTPEISPVVDCAWPGAGRAMAKTRKRIANALNI